jgi:hypothetical protein
VNRLALAIARDRRDLPDLPGIARFAAGGLTLLHQEAPGDALTPALATLEAYASTVATLHARETVLPLRFGSFHASPASLDDWLRVRSDEWRELLDQVEGCHEMGLRVLLDPPDFVPRPPPSLARSDRPGTAYLEAAKARRAASGALEEQAARVTDQLLEALAGIFRQATVEDPRPGRERLVSLACLVPRSGVDIFRRTIERLRPRTPGKLLLSGPWPPYSFADLREILHRI